MKPTCRDGRLLIEAAPVVPRVPALAGVPDAGTIERPVRRAMTGDDRFAAPCLAEPAPADGVQARAGAPSTVAADHIRRLQ